jgi:hypothetical protein
MIFKLFLIPEDVNNLRVKDYTIETCRSEQVSRSAANGRQSCRIYAQLDGPTVVGRTRRLIVRNFIKSATQFRGELLLQDEKSPHPLNHD